MIINQQSEKVNVPLHVRDSDAIFFCLLTFFVFKTIINIEKSEEFFMKERSLLHFMAAMVISILTLISFIVMFATWSKAYADDIIPVFYVLLIPTIILWIGWIVEDRGFLLAGSTLIMVLFIQHLRTISILGNDIFITPQYAPIVRTIYVLSFGLLLGASILSFLAAYFIHKKKI